MAPTTDARSRRIAIAAAFACAGVAGVALLAGTVETQPAPPVIVRAEAGREILRLDPATGTTRTIFSASNGIISHVVDVEDRGRVALAERGPEWTDPTGLVVLDPDGRVLLRKGGINVRELAWCCGENRLAVLTGTQAEGGIGFRPDGVVLVDVTTGAEERIQGLPDVPFSIQWVEGAGALFVRVLTEDGPQVYRYDPDTRRATRTPHRALGFSPDGRFYAETKPEIGPFRVYRASDDADVTDRLQLPPEIEAYDRGVWSPDAPNLLLFTKTRYEAIPRDASGPILITPEIAASARSTTYVVNVETGRVVRTLEGAVDARWETNAAALPLTQDGRVELIRLRDARP